MKVKFSKLWVVVLFNMIFADILGFILESSPEHRFRAVRSGNINTVV